MLIQGLNLTAASFDQSTLTATIQQIADAMATNPAYTEAVAVRPGWTFNLIFTQISLVNSYNGLMLLPILSAVSQLLMTKVTGGMNQQNAAGGQGAGAGKFMQWFFPIFSLVICFSYSAAFALYWVSGNLVSMAQTVAINKVLDNKEQAAQAVAGEGNVK